MAQNARLEHIIAYLPRLTLAKRSEQMNKDQPQLALEGLQQAAAEIEAGEQLGDTQQKDQRVRQCREKRPSLPDHLPQVETIVAPASTLCPC